MINKIINMGFIVCVLIIGYWPNDIPLEVIRLGIGLCGWLHLYRWLEADR